MFLVIYPHFWFKFDFSFVTRIHIYLLECTTHLIVLLIIHFNGTEEKNMFNDYCFLFSEVFFVEIESKIFLGIFFRCDVLLEKIIVIIMQNRKTFPVNIIDAEIKYYLEYK